MRSFALVLMLVLATFSSSVYGQELENYYLRTNFLMTAPGSFQEGMLGFANPANINFIHKFESRFYWSTEQTDLSRLADWAILAGVRGLAFNVVNQEMGRQQFRTYQIATGFGSQSGAFGFGYNWAGGDAKKAGQEPYITVGSIIRPFRYVSLGLTGNFSTKSYAKEGVAEIGIRPLGTPRLTLFADGALQYKMRWNDAPWSAGAAVMVFPGLNLVGRYFDSEAFTVGFTLDFGKSGVGSQLQFDSNSTQTSDQFMIRFGGMQPSIFPALYNRNEDYLSLDLKGDVDYLKYVLFDTNNHRLYDVLSDIRSASRDPRIQAIAVNLSSVSVSPELAWEIQEALLEARHAHKLVFVFIDSAGMTLYHLASAANIIVMDPEGQLMLPGYILGRTYLKGTLEKLGLGFESWRYFKYKSFLENLTRDNMSPADSEQTQVYLDDWYISTRSEVCENRRFSHTKFDSIINQQVFLMPDTAIAAGLADTLARWPDMTGIMKKYTGKELKQVAPNDLLPRAYPPSRWGKLPQIALVYALGECEMDRGIRARWLGSVFDNLTDDDDVKAVVFRVDSPGGEGMASDVVAEALRKCSKKKPVVVSQGQVAASGGYWISMYGNEIIAGPNTVTGSIGVIGGWIYDKGLGKKLGMTSDFVKKGEHADLGFGIRLPYTPLHVPARNLTPEEQARVKAIIEAYYDNFVKKVSEGRGMSISQVRKLAQGRIYSGLRGNELGLVDKIGGMLTALAVARERAGLAPNEEVDIIEKPKYRGLFDFGLPLPPVATQMENDAVYQFIRTITEHPGEPLPLLPPGNYPDKE